jgi:transglutaminase-like putative cysteine protease
MARAGKIKIPGPDKWVRFDGTNYGLARESRGFTGGVRFGTIGPVRCEVVTERRGRIWVAIEDIREVVAGPD